MERGGSKNYSYPPQNILEGNGVLFKNFTVNNYDYKCLLFIIYGIFYLNFFQNDDQLLIRFHKILTVFFLDEHM